MIEAIKDMREDNIHPCKKCGNKEGNIVEVKKDGLKVFCNKCKNLIFEKKY